MDVCVWGGYVFVYVWCGWVWWVWVCGCLCEREIPWHTFFRKLAIGLEIPCFVWVVAKENICLVILEVP